MEMECPCYPRMGSRHCVEERDAISRSKAIDKTLVQDGDKSSKEVKILLLGAGGSGKSTIAKQMKNVDDNGFSEEDLLRFKPVIYSKTIVSMVTILRAMEKLKIVFKDPSRASDAKMVFDVAATGNDTQPFTQELTNAMKRLWADGGVRQCFESSTEYKLNDSTKYYLDDLDRLAESNYRPTDEDVQRTRVKTSGIVEIRFTFRRLHFRLLDVGGMRTERRKWIHCFQEMTAIIFCADLSCYDLNLVEDESTNRMVESLKFFDSIVNSHWFLNTSVILFLNQIDLFEEKIGRSPITTCFKDYKGDGTSKDACNYIRERYLERNRNETREIYVHFTCATDTENVDFVFKAVTNMIITANLRKSGRK